MGEPGSILGLGRSPGEGKGYPLQYSSLKNSMDRGARWATVHEVGKSWTGLVDFHFHFHHSKHCSLALFCQIRSDQSLSRVRLFATPWIAAHQASLSITNSRSSLRLMSIESVMSYSHLILCRPLLLLPPIPPSIRVFSNESTLRSKNKTRSWLWLRPWTPYCQIQT